MRRPPAFFAGDPYWSPNRQVTALPFPLLREERERKAPYIHLCDLTLK